MKHLQRNSKNIREEYQDIQQSDNNAWKYDIPIKHYGLGDIIEDCINKASEELGIPRNRLTARYDDKNVSVSICEIPEIPEEFEETEPEPTPTKEYLGNGQIILDDNTRIEFESLRLVGKSNPDSWFKRAVRE